MGGKQHVAAGYHEPLGFIKVRMDTEMGEFVLRKGTKVKHGTSLSRARLILEGGFTAGLRSPARIINELQPEQNGIYIGEIISYFGAYASYTAELVELMASTQYVDAVNKYFENPKKIEKVECSLVPDTLPVVLVLELGDDCVLKADEDFVLDGRYPANEKIPTNLLESEAENVWKKWLSGCLHGDIKREWIKEIEYPSLNRMTVSKPDISRSFWSDVELFAYGLLQSYKKELPRNLIENYYEHYGEVALSQKVPATKEGIKEIEGHPRFNSGPKKLCNHVAITSAMEELTSRYGIALHRSA